MRLAALLTTLLLASPIRAAEPATPRSPRNADYRIEVTLDAAARMLEGRQLVEWRNTGSGATDELWFHLYWNAWRNSHSSWMREDRERGRKDREENDREDWGWQRVTAARLVSGDVPDVDLLPGMRYAAPDDGNPEDRTVMVLKLPEAVEPGKTVRVELVWSARIPRTFARTGHRGDFFFFAHWFPQLGVFEERVWNCHQYHAATEYFADYGVYEVALTLSERFVVGASGRETDRSDNRDGTTTHRYRAADVHGFAWTASPTYLVREARFEEAGLPAVDLRLLIQPEHAGQTQRHLDATRHALRLYGSWYGPYPYDHLTLVDPAWGSGAGGMEYPTLFTCGTRLFNPWRGDSPEGVTVHEAGHQFWYGLVGNNEFEFAWLDEGLNTFSTIRVLERAYPPRLLVRRYLPLPGGSSRRGGLLAATFPGIEVSRWSRRIDAYRQDATADDPSTPTYLYHPGTAGSITYSKTALWLATLERHLGWPLLRRILSTFFERYRFGHPRPEDFFEVAEEVTEQDLDWFFDQVWGDSVVFDYGIQAVSSVPAHPEGWVEQDGELTYRAAVDEEDADLFRTEVVVRRYGGGRFPVDVLLIFEDGREVRERWNGLGRSKRLVVEHRTKLDYAEVDPNRILMLDTSQINNSRRLEDRARLPAVKWGTKWMLWLQGHLATFGFFL